MVKDKTRYKAIFSSDWNECLAPCGPFDFIAFNHPELAEDLNGIFRQYTGNRISLKEAVNRIQSLLPAVATEDRMDAYLDHGFSTYQGVPELIQWCAARNILFMINTTGMLGYFQRVFARGLLPPVPVLSAHPMIRYPGRTTDPKHIYDLLEIRDKSQNTAAAVRDFNISSGKIILMGDSGGDGPHFLWGAEVNAFLIGSMTKASLEKYVREKGLRIDLRFGVAYAEGEKKNLEKELQVDFMALTPAIEQYLAR